MLVGVDQDYLSRRILGWKQNTKSYKGHRIELRRAPGTAALRRGDVAGESQPELLMAHRLIMTNSLVAQFTYPYYSNLPGGKNETSNF